MDAEEGTPVNAQVTITTPESPAKADEPTNTAESTTSGSNYTKVYGPDFQHKCNNITTTVQTAKTAAELQCVALDSAADIAEKTDYMRMKTVCDPDKKLCAYKVKDMLKGKSGVMCCKIDSGAGSVTCDIRNEKNMVLWE